MQKKLRFGFGVHGIMVGGMLCRYFDDVIIRFNEPTLWIKVSFLF